MRTPYQQLLDDLRAEQEALADLVEPLSIEGLRTPTPAEGWDIADSLAHLAGFDDAATFALTSPEKFAAEVARQLAEADDPIAAATERGRQLGPEATRTWWGQARSALLGAASGVDPKLRVPWYGPAMSAMSFLTARLMETWAHGQDIRDALGVPPLATDRLRHVAHIGVGARAYSYLVRGMEAPEAPVDVVLAAPGGGEWRWGPGDAPDRVEADALDFCLLVTQRRHRDDLDICATGSAAEEWLSIAQSFAGSPGSGRQPGQFG
jgi:uncharacterized protein (TIGR03084 family)